MVIFTNNFISLAEVWIKSTGDVGKQLCSLTAEVWMLTEERSAVDVKNFFLVQMWI